MRRLCLLFLLLVVAVSLGACQCGRCDASTCAGCCDVQQQCLNGQNSRACGDKGNACFVCAPAEVCWRGRCGVPGPGFGSEFTTSHSFDAGGNTVGGGAAGGGTAGGAAGGGTAGPPVPSGSITDILGKRCGVEGLASPDCIAVDAPPLACLAAVTSMGARFVCQFPCQPGASCANGRGQCRASLGPSRTCLDCVRGCSPANGQLNGDCLENELCVLNQGGGVCTPDCRLAGASCPASATCLPNGQCSGGALVSYCLAW